jgi:hypothetical protein
MTDAAATDHISAKIHSAWPVMRSPLRPRASNRRQREEEDEAPPGCGALSGVDGGVRQDPHGGTLV